MTPRKPRRPVDGALLDELARATESLLGADVRAHAVHLDPGRPPSEMFPEEAGAVASAIDKRRREFAGGRAAARRALARLGSPPVPIPRRPDRAPAWPVNVWGSITHTDEVALAAVTLGPGARASFGIDLEGAEPLLPDLLDYVARPDERRALTRDGGRLAKVVFSAKEAFYKAQHRHTGELLDFRDVRLELDPGRRSFLVEVVHAARSELPAGAIHGAWFESGGFLLTAVRLTPGDGADPACGRESPG